MQVLDAYIDSQGCQVCALGACGGVVKVWNETSYGNIV